MSNPLISIILPVFNGSRYIAESIESCLSQSYKNIELIIVDDHSTDDTPRIISRYKDTDKRVFVITHDTNKKLPAALNTGHRIAKGKFVTWTSDDNLFKTEAIVKMADVLCLNTETDIVFADVDKIDDKSNFVCRVTTGPAEELPIMNQMGACFLYHSDVFLRVGGYNEDLFGIEDYEFWLKCYNQGLKFAKIEESLYLYRLHEDSLSSKRQKAINYAAIKLVHENNQANQDKIPKEIRLRSYLKATRLARDIDDRELAKICYQRALEISPDAPNFTYQSLIDYATF